MMKTNETDKDRKAVRDVFDAAQDALNRMRRACERGTGCHLTAEMIASLELSAVGSLWAEDDPRHTDRR